MVDRLPANDGPRPDLEVTQEAPRAAVPDESTRPLAPDRRPEPVSPPPPSRPKRSSGRARAALVAVGRGIARGGRALRRWAHAPAGRVTIPGLALVGVLAASTASGRWLVPEVAPPPPPAPSAAPSSVAEPVNPPIAEPSGSALPYPSTSASQLPAGTRPVDALNGWASRISPAVGISPVALAAYGYAQLTVAQTTPACHLAWTTLAGIGKVESNHGTANGAILQPDGKVLPPIIGDALDGQGNRMLIRDTDSGVLDGDRTYDRAVGPMQFLPSTWEQYRVDADGDGAADPNDINDAALAAANYLCAGGRDLATADGWRAAVLSYNAIQVYVQAVFSAADEYGRRSRTVT